MSPQEKVAYKRQIENRRVEMNVMETAKLIGERKKAIDVAKGMLEAHLAITFIAQITKLTDIEVEQVARGEDILENYI
jgi:hypothetical protein